MNNNGIVWAVLVLALFIHTFSLHLCILLPACFLTFIAGISTTLYLYSKPTWYKKVKIEDLLDNPLESPIYSQPLIKVNSLLEEDEPKKEIHNSSMTGNDVVDSFLYEILGFVMGDYVTPWYDVVSENKEFLNTIRTVAQDLVINLSNRIKYTEWMPFFTGRLVEDITCHLRLFRASGGNDSIINTSVGRNSSRGSPARSPAQYHRRNKSDTDAAVPYSVKDYHKTIGDSKFYMTFNNQSVEDRFFQLEYEMEKKNATRKHVTVDESVEQLFVAEITQLILYMTVEANELKSRTAQSVLRAICSFVLQAAFYYITDPDNVNTLTLKMSWRDAFSNESFLNVLKTTDNIEELKTTLNLVRVEIQKLISCDLVGECDITVKQQLSSLQYLLKMLEGRCSALAPSSNNIATIPSREFTDVGLDFLLENHLGLGHFLDYALHVGAHSYIPCYLNIQAWKVAVLKYLSPESVTNSSDRCDEKSIRAVARSIYDQYLCTTATNHLQLPVEISKRVAMIISKPISLIDLRTMDWFEDVEICIQEKLESLLVGFRESNQYMKLLAELGVEGYNILDKSDQKKSFGSKSSLNSLTDKSNDGRLELSHKSASQESIEKWITNQEPCFLETMIVETGLTQEHGKWFGIYAIEVKKKNPITGKQHHWHVYRRYSDFHDLYALIKDSFPELSKIEFPSKKTFHNKSRSVLEQRKVVLNKWLSTLSALGAPGGPVEYASLHSSFLLPFLRYERQQSVGKIDSMLVQPLKQGMKTLKNVPGQLINTVDDILEGITKVINAGNEKKSEAPAFHSRLESSVMFPNEMSNFDCDELPLRVVLTLLDEVFELKQQNRWLRRQIAALLRQLMTSMFANVLNRIIIDYVSSITSPATMVYILDEIKYKFWGDTSKTDYNNLMPRSSATKARTRVAVKTFLLSLSQYRLKRIIGSQTTHRGVVTVFKLFQSTTLNKRLLYILIEDMLNTLYPESNVKHIFQLMLKNQDDIK